MARQPKKDAFERWVRTDKRSEVRELIVDYSKKEERKPNQQTTKSRHRYFIYGVSLNIVKKRYKKEGFQLYHYLQFLPS